MSLLDLFKKKAPEPPQKAAKPDDAEEMEIYSGMRVEVTDTKDIFLFVAKLLGLRGSQAELHQYSEDEISFPADQEPMPVKIRGYSDHERKAGSRRCPIGSGRSRSCGSAGWPTTGPFSGWRPTGTPR